MQAERWFVCELRRIVHFTMMVNFTGWNTIPKVINSFKSDNE